MSKRFGRNQKRALVKCVNAARIVTMKYVELAAKAEAANKILERKLEAFADLEQGLFRALGGHYKLADGHELAVLPDKGVTSWNVSESGGHRELDTTQASVELKSFVFGEELIESLYDKYRKRTAVAWRGRKWYIDNVSSNSARYDSISESIIFSLIAIGDK